MEIPVWLDPGNCKFPDSKLALQEPNGLLAIGGSLAPEVLIAAYAKGIFPWYSDDQPILWWSPDPRAVLFPDQLHVSRSLIKTLKKSHYKVTFDQAFDQVIMACAMPRTKDSQGVDGTWITAELMASFKQLHQLGYAHSVEVWQDASLVGGVYGLAIDRVFFGESMFHRQRDASKIALVHLVKRLSELGFQLIDCQQATGHLLSMGAISIERQLFNDLLAKFCLDFAVVSEW
jgi:leucyl/phenylalanyl-tRNA--protein transferase